MVYSDSSVSYRSADVVDLLLNRCAVRPWPISFPRPTRPNVVTDRVELLWHASC